MAKSDNFALVETAGFALGAFNKYVDKMRGEGGQKMSVLSTLRYEKWPRRVRGQKMAEFCPRSC